jgi:hypothetical protein
VWVGVVVIAVLVAVLAVTYFVTRSSDQARVGADGLPTVAEAQQAAAYVDCSKISSIAYFSNNPCQTFVLLESDHFSSAEEFLAAESRQLMAKGWRHSDPQPVDFDGGHGGLASPSQSWGAPANRVCAYVATARGGVAAETREIFPQDPYDVPQGVYDFYWTAKAASTRQALWVRLRPPNDDGRCVG